MTKENQLAEALRNKLTDVNHTVSVGYSEVTVECESQHLKNTLTQLRDNPLFLFNQLIDVCGVDYLHYGQYDWETREATETGFSRGVERQKKPASTCNHPRFAVVYHLLSTSKNHRIRVKVYLNESQLSLPSVHDLYKSANWFEREAYDLFGILFEGHPDLRRILTDYGFIGHPFRKDFPVSGHVEMRYDAGLQKVIYQPVDIEPRVLVPKVIRKGVSHD